MVDTLRLRGHIRRSGYKLSYIARMVGVSPNTLHQKLENRTDFKMEEALRLSRLLSLSNHERDACFWFGLREKQAKES